MEDFLNPVKNSVPPTEPAPTEHQSKVLQRFVKNLRRAGVVRDFLKVLVSGESKAGKSYLAAGAPHPILAIDTGEGGIEPYLREDLGDRALYADDPKEVVKIVQAFEPEFEQGIWKTLALDSYTVFWDEVVDWGRTELTKKGRDEAQFADWGWIKKDNKVLRKLLMGLQGNVVLTAWLKDLEMVRDENVAPGVKAKTEVRKVSKANVEKTIPYFFDFWFELGKGLDKEGHPNGIYTAEFCGGRIPSSIPVDLLYEGRTWTYDTRKEGRKSSDQVWNELIGWTVPFRKTGAPCAWVGLDAEEGERVWQQARDEANDEAVGKIVTIMQGVKSLAEYPRVFEKSIAPLVIVLNPDMQKIVMKLHAQRKYELEQEREKERASGKKGGFLD